jgi:hypothetical protein
MKRAWTIILSILATLAVVALPTDAARKKKAPAVQSAPTFLRVHVTDERGRAIYHARVFIHRLGTRRRGVGRTNRAGNFDSRHSAGSFSVAVTHSGLLRAAGAIGLHSGEAGKLDIRMVGRHILLLHAHEEHRLGLIHRAEHDEHHESKLHDEASHSHESSGKAPSPGHAGLPRP